MNLDEALSQPLPSVPDGGFSARMIPRLSHAEERRRLLLWAAAVLALLPPLALLTLLPVTQLALRGGAAQVASSPVFTSAAGALVLLWTLRPTRTRF